MSEESIKLLHQSIQDTQSTIRAIDVKSGFIFLVIAQPLWNLKSIACFFHPFVPFSFSWWVGIFTALIWTLSLILLLKTLIPISKAQKNITEGAEIPDCFFVGNQFTLTTMDLFINCYISSKSNPAHLLETIKRADVELVLANEKLILCYIRDIKIKRINMCIICVSLWILMSATLYLIKA